MSNPVFLDLFSRNNKRVEQTRQKVSYSLRLPDETISLSFPNEDAYDGDTLRIMPPDINPKVATQPLSLPEKKFLYDFWCRQWQIFKASPACQNVSEKRLLEKFDRYISINVRRYLVKDWNNTFAGGYVSGEPEPRAERDPDDLRALTKSWGWLCKELRFKAWPLTIDHENENLENVRIEVRNKPFGIAQTGEGSKANDGQPNQQDGVSSSTEEDEDSGSDLSDEGVQKLARETHDWYRNLRRKHENEIINGGITRSDPRFTERVDARMYGEVREIEERGFINATIAKLFRDMIYQYK